MPQTRTAFDRFTPAHVRNPYPLYARLRDEDPFHDPTLDLWIVARYEDVRVVLADSDRFRSDFTIRTPQQPPPEVAAVLAGGHPEVQVLLNQDPPEHTAVRALVAGAFSPRRVRALTPTVERLAAELVDRVAPAGRADLVEALTWPLPLLVTCELLGLPTADAQRIRAWIDALGELTSYGAPLERQVAAAHESVAFERYLAGFVAAKRAAPEDDLTSELAAATDPALTDAQLISLLITLVFGGHETTSNLIATALLHVLAGETAGVDAAVEEALRHDPPVQGMFRRTAAEVELGGVTLPAGVMVFALIGSANRDPAAFPDPDAYRPGRSGAQHLAFGRGVHFCVGAQLARMEARVAITTLLDRLPGIRLSGQAPPYLPNLMHRGPRRVDAAWPT
jgi:cytochrome P450